MTMRWTVSDPSDPQTSHPPPDWAAWRWTVSDPPCDPRVDSECPPCIPRLGCRQPGDPQRGHGSPAVVPALQATRCIACATSECPPLYPTLRLTPGMSGGLQESSGRPCAVSCALQVSAPAPTPPPPPVVPHPSGDPRSCWAQESSGSPCVAGDSLYRERYERSRREAEFSRKRLVQQHEEEMEQLEAAKKHLDRKVGVWLSVCADYVAEPTS